MALFPGTAAARWVLRLIIGVARPERVLGDIVIQARACPREVSAVAGSTEAWPGSPARSCPHPIPGPSPPSPPGAAQGRPGHLPSEGRALDGPIILTAAAAMTSPPASPPRATTLPYCAAS